MDDAKYYSLITVSVLTLAGLMVLGAVFPGPLLWGVHFLGFLPNAVVGVYVAAVALLYWMLRQGMTDRLLTRLSLSMERSPRRFIVAAGVIFVAAAILFRVKASLLGDSTSLVYNFRDYAAGNSYLAPWHEPASMWLLYPLVKFLGTFNFPAVEWSFLAADVFYGLGFLLFAFLAVREMFATPLSRMMAFLLCAVMPYMELCFGYIETYAPVLFLLAVYVWLSVRVLNGKSAFWLVPPVYVLLTLSHYTLGILGPGMAYLALLEYRQRHFRQIAAGIGMLALIVAVVLVLAGFDRMLLVDESPISHFLSLTMNISPVNQYSQPYTLLSPYHIVDFVNFLLLMCPLVIVVIAAESVRDREQVVVGSPLIRWLAAGLIPFVGLMFLSKLEQGISSDWDVYAGGFFLVTLYAAVLFFRREDAQRVRIFSYVLMFTALHSAVWFTLNATTQPAIRRYQSLYDSRILSHLGDYTHTLREFRFYAETGDTAGQLIVWQRYCLRRPEDPRGYDHALTMLEAMRPGDYLTVAQVYERWLSVDRGNDSLRLVYASYCNDIGTIYYRSGQLDTAGFFFQRAAALDTTSSHACNNLGSVLAQRGRLDEAAVLFRRAIRLDSTYSDAMFNLGNVLIDRGDKAQGTQILKKAALLGNVRARQQTGMTPGE